MHSHVQLCLLKKVASQMYIGAPVTDPNLDTPAFSSGHTEYVFHGLNFNPVALRKVKIVYSFGLSECNRVKRNRKEFVFCIYMCLIQPEFDV